jgi:hypothetical protein
MPTRPTYAFYGHHKCATMTLNTIAGGVCRRLGLNYEAVFDAAQFQHDLPQFVATKHVDFLFYGNANIEHVSKLPAHKGFHIIRDPRDIVVSAYFSHMHSHPTEHWPELEPHRETLKGLTKDEGLAEEIRFRGKSLRHMMSWDYAQPLVLEVRFEDLTSRAYETLLTAFDFLGLIDNRDYKISRRASSLLRECAAVMQKAYGWRTAQLIGSRALPAVELLALIWRNRFEARTKGRSRGEEDVSNHYRKGETGDWANHFSSEHKELFKSLYPDLVPKLGYAESDNW